MRNSDKTHDDKRALQEQQIMSRADSTNSNILKEGLCVKLIDIA